MTRELCSEGWTVDKLRMVNQIKPKYRKWTPESTGTIDRDKCNRTVIGPYDQNLTKVKDAWDVRKISAPIEVSPVWQTSLDTFWAIHKVPELYRSCPRSGLVLSKKGYCQP